MKKIVVALISTLMIFCAFAESNVELDPVTGFPVIEEKPFVAFDWGSATTLATRVQTQENRSNFVRQDVLTGAYIGMETFNMKPCDSIIKISAFYPIYHSFNGMKQKYTQMFLFAVDVFAGPVLEMDMWHYIRFNFSIGMHYYYQLTDDFSLHYLGAAGVAGLELPVTKKLTLIADGVFTFDYPNLGTNQKMQPYNFEWQYQGRVGVRISKKAANEYSYIGSKK